MPAMHELGTRAKAASRLLALASTAAKDDALNAAFLRGSSAAIESNKAIAAVLREGFAKAGLPEDALVLVEDTSHEAAVEFMQLRQYVDCLIPRGGPALIGA